MLANLEKAAKGVEQKRLVKDIKASYTKEIERQTRLLKSFVNQSFEHRITRLSLLKQQRGMQEANDQGQFFLDPSNVYVDKDNLNSQKQNEMIIPSKSYSINDMENLDQQDMTQEDIVDLERQLVMERYINNINCQVGGIR